MQVWVATNPVDMRKGFDGLAEVVRVFLGHDPLSGSLFVFRNRSAQRLKILWYDRGGWTLYYRRLDRGTFPFPAADEKTVAIDSGQLLRLLSGATIVASPSR
jgi:transposase